MKKESNINVNKIITVICIFCSVTSIFAQKINYKVEKKDQYSFIKVEIIINDTVVRQNNIENYFEKRDKSDTLYSKTINYQFFKSVQNNKNIKLYLVEPKYITEIINLISSESDRDKAKIIYYENTYHTAIKVNTKSNTKNFNGKSYREIIIEISLPVIVKATCEFKLENLIFYDHGKSYKINKIQFPIEK